MENRLYQRRSCAKCEDSLIKGYVGYVTISSGSVIHPSAQIIDESGLIIIGENCIIEEYVKIIHKIPEAHKLYVNPDENPDKRHVLVIGSNNIFEVGCVVESLKIGEKNIFECKSYVGPNVTVLSGCVIGGSIIYGSQLILRKLLLLSTLMK